MAKTKNQKVASFDKANLREILAECEVALNAVAARHGIVLTQSRCTYSATEFRLPFGMMVASTEAIAGANAMDAKIAGDYVKYASSFGLKPEWLGKSYDDVRYKRVTIVGISPKSRRFPVIVEVEGGKRFKFPLDAVIAGMTPNEVAKAAPGTKVTWKHEYEHRGRTAGPAWVVDAEGKRYQTLKETSGVIEAVDEDMSDVDPVTGARPYRRDRPAPAWVSRDAARRYADRIGAAFVEV